ncbi:MAG: FAD-dependent oxidoreductase [Actinomycetota bacterium]
MSEVLVVGAGMAGLVAATELVSSGHRVTVVDKGRGVGGRTATRRFAGATFDHGAQFFTTRSGEGAELADAWAEAGAVGTWHTAFLGPDGETRDDGHVRRRGVPSMTGPAKLLAAALGDVRTGVRLVAVERDGRRWAATDQRGGQIGADALVLTPPVPQTIELLHGVDLGPGVSDTLASLRYERCVAVMVVTDGPTAVPEPGAVRPADGPVEWLADNHRKGVSERPCLTIHLRPEQSLDWWDRPDAEVVERATDAVDRWLGAEVVESQVHRWRYARPVVVHPERSLTISAAPPAVAAGDVFGGPLVEGAMRSGLDAARRVGELLGGAS